MQLVKGIIMNINLMGTDDSINILKLCLLYFDEVTIEIPWFYDTESSFHIENDFTKQLFYLKKHFGINTSFFEFNMPCFVNRRASNYLLEMVIDNADFIYENVITIDNNQLIYGHNTKIRDKEFDKFISQTYEPYIAYVNNMFNDSKINSNVGKIEYSNNLLGCYFGNLFSNLAEKKSVISDLEIINRLMQKNIDKTELHSTIKNSIKLNCVSIMLPNLSYATFEDIYEIKSKLKDELQELQSYIDSLAYDINIENIGYSQKIIVNKIKIAIRNFEYKLKDLKINTVQKFISEIKNPLSYVPLIGSLFTDIPASISLLTSLGFIGMNTGLEYIKQKDNIKTKKLIS